MYGVDQPTTWPAYAKCWFALLNWGFSLREIESAWFTVGVEILWQTKLCGFSGQETKLRGYEELLWDDLSSSFFLKIFNLKTATLIKLYMQKIFSFDQSPHNLIWFVSVDWSTLENFKLFKVINCSFQRQVLTFVCEQTGKAVDSETS